MRYLAELHYNFAGFVSRHYKSVIVAVVLGTLLFDFTATEVTVDYKRINSMMLTNEFTQDSVEVKHLVLRNEDGTLSVINNFEYPARAGQRLVIIKQQGRITGINYITTIHGVD